VAQLSTLGLFTRAMRRLALILLVVVLLVVAAIGWLRYTFHSARRQAESAVAQTVERIRGMGALDTASLQLITNAAVGGSSVQILSTNPIAFRVTAHTPWPDWMIYEYDSKTPERGIHHYLF
jgi:hypothetical protein